MRVLIVSQYFWPESFRINEVVSSLRKAKCEVTVLTGQPNYPDGVVFSGYGAWRFNRQLHVEGYDILRVPLFPRGRGGAVRLVLNYLSFIASAACLGPWLLRNRSFDVVFVYAPSPILQTIPAIWIALLKRVPVVTWVQDLWPESLAETGFVRNPRVLNGIATVVRWIYARCDLLLVQSPEFVEPVKTMSGSTPVFYHPNPGEVINASTTDCTQALPAFKAGFNVVFAGNMGSVQALPTVLDAAALLLAFADVHFVLVGSGSMSNWLQAEVSRRGLFNVCLAGRYPPECMPAILANASALLVSLCRSPAMSQTVPSKVQAYLAAGRPIIASMDGAGARLVDAAGAGVTAPAENAQALADAVLLLHGLPADRLREMGDCGRAYHANNYDASMLAAKLKGHFVEAKEIRNLNGKRRSRKQE